MACSEARLNANRANAARSTGPRTPEGKARSRRNALKDGLTGAGVELTPELGAQLPQRRAAWEAQLLPTTPAQTQLVHQIALSLLQFEQLTARESDLALAHRRDRLERWEPQRWEQVEALGARLSENPAVVLFQLEGTSEGCDWLIQRWEELLDYVDEQEGCGWDDAMLEWAIDLTGPPATVRRWHACARRLTGLRDRAQGDGPDAVAARVELAAFIRESISELDQRAERLWVQVEQIEREALKEGCCFDFSEEARYLRRLQLAAWRRYEKAHREFERLKAEEAAAAAARYDWVPPPPPGLTRPPAPHAEVPQAPQAEVPRAPRAAAPEEPASDSLRVAPLLSLLDRLAAAGSSPTAPDGRNPDGRQTLAEVLAAAPGTTLPFSLSRAGTGTGTGAGTEVGAAAGSGPPRPEPGPGPR